MRKAMMAVLSAAALVATPLLLAQDGRGAAAGGGAGRGARGGQGAQMQERMKQAWTEVDKAACFTAMDTNADGSISKDEFEKADLQAVFGTPLREAMAKRAGGAGAGAAGAGSAPWDKNGDGKITADEFPRGEEAFKRVLQRHDKDGDGTLSGEEAAAARAAMQQRQGQRQGQGRGQQ